MKNQNIFIKWGVIILTLSWWGFMLFLSHQNASESGRITGEMSEVIGELLYSIDNVSDEYKKMVLHSIHICIRSMAHIVVFFVLSILVFCTAKVWEFNKFYAFSVVVMWAIVDELLKYFTIGRHCDIYDMLKNLLGTLMGFVVSACILKIHNSRKEKVKNCDE